MPIRYSLRRNTLRGTTQGYLARARPTGTADQDDVAAQMRANGCPLSKEVIGQAMDYLGGAIEDLLLQGLQVSTPVGFYRLAIRGRFEEDKDRYDRERHQVALTITPTQELRQAIREKARLVRRASRHRRPEPMQYRDMASGARDSSLTPGGVGRLSGSLLKFDPADPRQGVFFIAANGQAVRSEVVVGDRPKELIFVVSPLPAGRYRLEVRAILRQCKGLRSGRLDKALTVL